MAWIKTSPWGDYKDPLQNHKFDGDLHFINKDSNEIKVFTRISNILHEARWHFSKHIGSKKLANVMALNRKANSIRAIVKKAVQEEKLNSANAQQ